VGLRELIPITAPPMIEEVERSNDDKFWLITLSYPPIESPQFYLPGGRKDYKQFKVNADSGEIEWMKIRTV
jgi:hypothetical protein